MNSIRHFENHNLKDRSTYIMWLLLVIAGIIGFQLLMPIIKPNRYSGAITEWIFSFFIIIVLTVFLLLRKRFVSITFNLSSAQITLTTTSLLNGAKTNHFNSSDISYKNGKEKAGFRKGATEFIEIYYKKEKLIRIDITTIGEYTFYDILNEFEQKRKLE